MSDALVSVVVPVRDRAGMVLDAVRSVQQQTGVAVEILVVDDGSSDGTVDVVSDLAREDPRISVLRSPCDDGGLGGLGGLGGGASGAGGGPAAARNAGVRAARGEYLAFLDSDDLFPTDRLRRHVASLAARPDAVAVAGALRFFDAWDPQGMPRPDAALAPYHDATLVTTTFRTERFRAHGSLEETLRYAEDVDYFLRLLEVDATLMIDAGVACWCRRHPANMTADAAAKQCGYVQAYARSVRRRREAGRTRPLEPFFPRTFAADVELGGGHVLQEIRGVGDPPGLTGYLNSFLLPYWRDLAGLRTLRAVVEVEGVGVVRLRRTSASGETEVIAEIRLSGAPRVVSFEIPIEAPSGDGVVTVEASAGALIRRGSWVTSDPPGHDVRLAVVICTRHRPDAVAENVPRLRRAGVRVIVVDQGEAPFTPPDGAEVIRQANFGGTGGFVRGILRAMETDATHVLLLDDDVRVDAGLASRLQALLARLARPTTIGGQMLDLTRPTVLHAAAERFDLRRGEIVNPSRDTDLSTPGAMASFATVSAADFAAWWCCCIPVTTLADNLPLPMFIRHDDIEHGLRTIRTGGSIAVMPGIFVWHEPFAAKEKPWYAYYDFRNKLILAALHGSGGGRRLAWWLLAASGRAFLHRRYDVCWAYSRAARDFLSGPAVVFSGPRERQTEIVAGVARAALLTVRVHQARHAARDRSRAAHVRTLHRAGLLGAVATIGAEAAAGVLGLAVRGGRVAGAYRASRAHHTSERFWREHLGLAP